MDKVITLPVVTRLDLNADRTLDGLKGKLEGFVLAGYGLDGEYFYSSTYADGGDALWLIEQFKKVLLSDD